MNTFRIGLVDTESFKDRYRYNRSKFAFLKCKKMISCLVSLITFLVKKKKEEISTPRAKLNDLATCSECEWQPIIYSNFSIFYLLLIFFFFSFFTLCLIGVMSTTLQPSQGQVTWIGKVQNNERSKKKMARSKRDSG